MKRCIPFTALLLFLAACEGGTGPGNGGNVAVRFSTGSSAAHVSANVLTAGDAVPSADQLTVTGTNGTIVIDDIRFIVEEMELRSSDANAVCDDDEHEIDDDFRVSADGQQGQNDDEHDRIHQPPVRLTTWTAI